MDTKPLYSPAPMSSRRLRHLTQLVSQPKSFIYECFSESEAGVFNMRRGISTLVGKIGRGEVATLLEKRIIVEYSRSARGVRYARSAKAKASPRTALDRRRAKFLEAERVFDAPSEPGSKTVTATLGESPLGWLSRRKNAHGKAFLTDAEVGAGERLRMDFERAQLAPGVTQDWRRFLTPGGTGNGLSAQERAVDGGAEAARNRVMDALADLGPGLSDVALRTCCFLEGLETVEATMAWSARSGKIVLKIALQRLVDHYECIDPGIRNGEIRVWQASAS